MRTKFHRAMPRVLLTFDLKNAEYADYERGYEALVLQGLSRVSANVKTRLPRSSVLGNTDVGKTAQEICQVLKKVLAEATRKEVERVLVAVVTDWACSGPVDEDLWLQELVTRFADAASRLEIE
ncbi:hypothetical protein WMF38_05070 [Sorangium sp. So ce118]